MGRHGGDDLAGDERVGAFGPTIEGRGDVFPQRRCLPADAIREGTDDLGEGHADEIVAGGGGRVAVEHGHDQAQRFGLGEHDGRQLRASPEAIAAVAAAYRLDRHAGLAKDGDVPPRRPRGDAERASDLLGRRLTTELQDLERAQRPRGRAEVEGHAASV